MPQMVSPDSELSLVLKERAKELGFDLVGIAPAARPDTLDQFQDWLRQGFQGEMSYLTRRAAAYEHPRGVLPSVRTIIVTALNYGPGQAPAAGTGRIAAYAQGEADYHEVLRTKLQALADVVHHHRPGCQTRAVVDTAPLLERDVARRAGLGWFGKNTMLINKQIGSLFFLGGLLTDCELPPDAPHASSHCGTCTRCLEACPTQAFPEPYVLDATRCISYLTIELRDAPIPRDLREGVGNWLFGCDVCQQVCPWNRKSPPPREPSLQPLLSVRDEAWTFLEMTEAEFQDRHGRRPLSRPGRAGMARNASIVLGNSEGPEGALRLAAFLEDPSPLVRGAVAWGLGQMGGAEAMAALQAVSAIEENSMVREEIALALERLQNA